MRKLICPRWTLTSENTFSYVGDDIVPYFVSFGIFGPIVESFKMAFCSCIRHLLDVYFTTLQLVLVRCGGGITSPRTLP